MDDLFDALRISIEKYMQMDELKPREKQRFSEMYGKFAYSPDVVDSLLDFSASEDDNAEK